MDDIHFQNKGISEEQCLRQHKKDFPDSLAFEDIGTVDEDPNLSRDERIFEFELEKAIQKVNETIILRREIYSAVEGRKELPTVSGVKPALQQRKQREQIIQETREHLQCEEPPNLSEALFKEVSLSTEAKCTPAFITSILLPFYEERLSSTILRRERLLDRWSKHCTNSELLARSDELLDRRLANITYEYNFVKSAHASLLAYKEQQMTVLQSTPINRIEIQTTPDSQKSSSNQAVGPDISHIRMWVNSYSHNARVTRRYRRFELKCKWLAITKRYELLQPLFNKAVESAQGTLDTSIDNQIPKLSLTDEEIEPILEELSTSFSITGTSEDSQEYMYVVNKRFSAVFASQCHALEFSPYELANKNRPPHSRNVPEPDNQPSGDGDNGGGYSKTYLAHSSWLPYESKVMTHGKQSPEVEAVRCRLHSNGGYVDSSLRVELGFLAETDTQYVNKRLREQAASHVERATVSANTTAKEERAPRSAVNTQDVSPAVTGPSNHKKQALYLLRYIRIREFRRRLLDILNYYASIRRRLCLDSHGYASASSSSSSSGKFSKKLRSGFQRQGKSALAKQFIAETSEREGVSQENDPSYTANILQFYHNCSDRGSVDDEPPELEKVEPTPDAASQQDTTFYKEAELQNRGDTYKVTGKSMSVIDSFDNPIMYTVALQDLEELEGELLRTASHYITRTPESTSSQDVDRVAILEDIFESETWFQSSKRKVIDAYMEAYEHCGTAADQLKLSELILEEIKKRPLLDLSHGYFVSSYTAETISNELMYTLQRDIVNCQIADEKRIIANIYKSSVRRDRIQHAGLPDQSVHDTRLYHNLFPGSSVVNVLDFYNSLSVISSLPSMLNDLTRTICSKFSVRGAELAYVRQHLLQLMVVEWKVLTEEERVQRQLQGAHLKSEEDDKSFVDDADSLSAIIRELVTENGTQDETAATSMQQTRQLWFDAVEIILNRNELMSALYETEILYNLHRKQGMVCGVDVRRFQFDSIDFETRKTIAEIDELDHDTVDMTEVISLKAEHLSKLAVGEFDQSLANFDFHTFQGVKKILCFSTLDLRRALTVQITQKNILYSACLYNQSPIDAHYCQVASEKVEAVTVPKPDKATFVTQQTDQQQGFTKARSATSKFAQNMIHKTSGVNDNPRKGIAEWSVFTDSFPIWTTDAGTIGEQQLQGLFVSVNQIKSTHRRNMLEELNTRTSEILKTKRPELLRKKMKELKHSLIDDYCLNIITCVVPLVQKWQVAELSKEIRTQCHGVPGLHAGAENVLLTYGGSSDIVEKTASGIAYNRSKTGGQSADASGRCAVTKDGRIEDAWYIPHILQVYTQCTWDSREDVREFAERKSIARDRKIAVEDCTTPHQHSSDIPSNLLTGKYLSIMTNNLHNLLCIVLVCKALSKLGSSSLAVTSGDNRNCFEGVAKEFRKVQLESELLSDPSDPRAVTEYLSAAHAALYLKLYLSASGLKKHLLHTKNEKNSAAQVGADIEDFQSANHRRDFINVDVDLASSVVTDSLLMGKAVPNTAFRNMQYRLANASSEGALKNDQPGQGGDLGIRDANLPASFNNNFYKNLTTTNWYPETTRMPWLNGVLLRLSDVDRSLIHQEVGALDQYLAEVRTDTALIEDIASGLKNGGHYLRDQTVAIAKASVFALQLNHQRDELKTLFCVYLPFLLKGGNITSSLPDESISDEDSYRMVIGKARTQYEIDLQERSEDQHSRTGSSKPRRRKRTEVGLRRKQVVLLTQEINKVLLQESISHTKSIQETLNASLVTAVSSPTDVRTRGSSTQETHTSKLAMFNEFHNTVMTRAVTLRQEGSEFPVYQIPENFLCLAIDQLGCSLNQWNTNHLRDIAQASELVIQHYRHSLFLAEQKILQNERLRELDKKALSRMVAAKFNDEKYNLIHKKNMLQKKTEELTSKLAQVEILVREAVKSEYDEEVAKLNNEISLLQAQFKDHKKKLYREMQINLEEIKRHAMMSIGKSEIAPLHMKRQALRIAINDEEANRLKEQNSELSMTVTKLKLWYELRLSRMDSYYQKKIDVLEKERQESSGRYWGDKEHIEEREELMKQQLHATQKSLSATEMEVEQLLRDLDLQEKKKKHLVAWKVAHSRLLEEVTRKSKRYEKYERYDIDRLLRTLEKDEKNPGGGGIPTSTGIGIAAAAGGSNSSKHPASAPPTSPAPNNSVGADPVLVSKEIVRLKDEVRKERRLKTKAFQKLTELREDQDSLTDEMVWQKKYFQCASELQKTLRDVQQYKDHIIQSGISLPVLTADTPSVVSDDRLGGKNLPPVSASPEPTRMGSAPGVRSEPRVFPRRPSTSTPTQRRVMKR